MSIADKLLFVNNFYIEKSAAAAALFKTWKGDRSEHLGEEFPGAGLLGVGEEGMGFVLLQDVASVHK